VDGILCVLLQPLTTTAREQATWAAPSKPSRHRQPAGTRCWRVRWSRRMLYRTAAQPDWNSCSGQVTVGSNTSVW